MSKIKSLPGQRLCSSLPPDRVPWETSDAIPRNGHRKVAPQPRALKALELALPTLSYFFVTVSAVDDAALRLSIHFDCAADFSVLARQYSGVGTERSEDGWFVTYRLTGGDAS